MAIELATPKRIQPRKEFADILKAQDEFAQPENSGTGNEINGWIDRLMIQSGTDMPPATLPLLCLMGALLFGGVAFVLQENLFAAAIFGILGFMTPVVLLVIAQARRQSIMMRQAPGMVDELARAAKTGRSLDQCLHFVADDTPSPLGDELKRCSQKLKMGLDLESSLSELASRTGLTSLRVLTTTLIVNQQTGGNLVKVLVRLASTLRDRLLFLGRLRAATSASRATALLMIIVPPAVLTFFTVRDPEYFNNLMASSWGRGSTIAGIVLQVIGTIWILRILQNSKRT